MAIVNTIAVKLELESKKFKQGLDSASRGIDGFLQKNKTLGDATLNLGRGIAGLSAGTTLAIGAVSGLTTKLVSLVKEQTAAADKFLKLSTATGVSVEALSQLKFAAGLSGATIEDVVDSFKTLGNQVIAFNRKSAGTVDAFKRLGITAEDTRKPLDQLLEQVADGLVGITNATERVGIAQQVLGGSAVRLLPLLSGGAEGIRALRKEADELGITVSEAFARKAEQFNENMARVKASVQGLKLQIAERLLPVAGEMSEFFAEFAKRNAPTIATAFARVAFEVRRTVLGYELLGISLKLVGQRLQEQALVGYGKLTGRTAEEIQIAQQGVREEALLLEQRLAAVSDQATVTFDDFVRGAEEAAGAVRDEVTPAVDKLKISLNELLREEVKPMMGGRRGAAFTQEAVLARIEQERRDAETLARFGEEQAVPGLVFERDVFGEAEIRAEEFFQSMTDLGSDAFNSLARFSDSFADGLIDAATGAKVAFGDFFKRLLKDLARAIARALILRAILGFFGGIFGGSFASIQKFLFGPPGGFPGPGDAVLGDIARSRNVPANLGSSAFATAPAAFTPQIIIHEASPMTWAEITDRQIQPRLRQRRDELNEEAL